jgi:CHASE3 domain sensor protein
MSTYTDEVQQQRAQLSRLYEQKEQIDENIKGLKQIIATLEYVADKEKAKQEEAIQNASEIIKPNKTKGTN